MSTGKAPENEVLPRDAGGDFRRNRYFLCSAAIVRGLLVTTPSGRLHFLLPVAGSKQPAHLFVDPFLPCIFGPVHGLTDRTDEDSRSV